MSPPHATKPGHYITLARWSSLPVSGPDPGWGRLPLWTGAAASSLGVFAAVWYARAGLTLSHYDAKAHLVVARRILDSLTPGWEQIGAVWLPLPHLVNALPVQIDLFYRTGLFAVAISILCHGVTAASLASTVAALTRSRAGALLAGALYAVNPNVLYLQSTPMTEPMLFALTSLQVCLFTHWTLGTALSRPRGAICVTVMACLTRYEAWPITAAILAATAWAWWRRGASARHVVGAHVRIALYPLATVGGFMLFSRITVGEWFVSGGFFAPDESLRGQPVVVFEKIAEGVEAIAGVWLLGASTVASVAIVALAVLSRAHAPLLGVLSLFATAALPATAYLSGHPFRLRYEVPLVVAGALASGIGVGLLRRAAPVVAVLLLALVVGESGPFDRRAPMVAEAQLDPHAPGRARVTACLARDYRGETIMMSMGALGHYMHEMSAAGFSIRNFLHEGNGPIWDSAFTRGPAPLVEWVIVEEFAEGGDAIIGRQRQYPRLLEDYDRVCEGGNIAAYRRKQGHRDRETQR